MVGQRQRLRFLFSQEKFTRDISLDERRRDSSRQRADSTFAYRTGKASLNTATISAEAFSNDFLVRH